MYNLENFYDFRTTCVNALALLEKYLPLQDGKDITIKEENNGELYSELRMELLKDKDPSSVMLSETPTVNPNSGLDTPPRLKIESDCDPNDLDNDFHSGMRNDPTNMSELHQNFSNLKL